jgi:hypothetical protein
MKLKRLEAYVWKNFQTFQMTRYKSYGHLDTLVLTDCSIKAASVATEIKAFPEHAGKVKFL